MFNVKLNFQFFLNFTLFVLLHSFEKISFRCILNWPMQTYKNKIKSILNCPFPSTVLKLCKFWSLSLFLPLFIFGFCTSYIKNLSTFIRIHTYTYFCIYTFPIIYLFACSCSYLMLRFNVTLMLVADDVMTSI